MSHIHPIVSVNSHHHRRQRSLSKMYKDLIVTKRDLIDLRQSIKKTIHSIKQSDQQLQIIQERRRISSLASAAPFRQNKLKAHPQPPKSPVAHIHKTICKQNFKCQHCNFCCENMNSLSKHKSQNHKICDKCNKLMSQELNEHLLYKCGEERFPCHECSLMIKKKDLDEHIKVCYFRQCFKCHRELYAPTLAYHLQICGKELINHKANNINILSNKLMKEMIPSVIPCCLILKKQDK